jgi:pimeloyl-ACP methyl ester carboxylesterase
VLPQFFIFQMQGHPVCAPSGWQALLRSVLTLPDRIATTLGLGMSQMRVNGIELEVRKIAGSATAAAIVFLHEGLGSVSLWTQRGIDWPQRVCGATGRAGVAYSRRGYGQSERMTGDLPADYMHREAWEALPALLDALHIDKPVLLGHSDGATIALLYASRHPVAACIAMAPHVLVEDVGITAIAAAKTAFESGGLRDRLARHHADVDGAFRQWNDVWLSEAFRSFDIRAECSRITAPLLLIQGVEDEYGTLRQLDEIALAAPHALRLHLPDCGHSPQRDQTEKTLEAVTSFLRSAN